MSKEIKMSKDLLPAGSISFEVGGEFTKMETESGKIKPSVRQVKLKDYIDSDAISENDIGYIFEGYASTGDKDSQGDVVMQDSIDLSRFMKNKVMLLDHDMTKDIGTYIEVVQRKKGLYVKGLVTVDRDQIFQSLKTGARATMSIGFMVRSADDITYDEKKDVYNLSNIHLYEISLVTVPANEFANFKMIDGSLTQNEQKALEGKSDLYKTIRKSYLENNKNTMEKNLDEVQEVVEEVIDENIESTEEVAEEVVADDATTDDAKTEENSEDAKEEVTDETTEEVTKETTEEVEVVEKSVEETSDDTDEEVQEVEENEEESEESEGEEDEAVVEVKLDEKEIDGLVKTITTEVDSMLEDATKSFVSQEAYDVVVKSNEDLSTRVDALEKSLEEASEMTLKGFEAMSEALNSIDMTEYRKGFAPSTDANTKVYSNFEKKLIGQVSNAGFKIQ